MKRKGAIVFVAIFFFFSSTLSLAVTPQEEQTQGKEINKEIRRSVPVNNDPYISLHIQTIKKRLEDAGTLPFPITLTVMDSTAADAFTTMGGHVYISTGLIELCEKEEELAGVIAHELGHVKKRHVVKQMEKQKYLNIGALTTMLLALAVGGSTQAGGAIMATGMAGTQAMSLKYSREDEEEADREGSEIADKAGYGGLGSADFLKRLRPAGTDKLLPQYLLTHPYHDERIIALEKMWPQNRVTVDGSFFPYIVVRAQILHKSRLAGTDDMTVSRYEKDTKNPVNNYAACLIYSLKGNNEAAIRTARENTSPYRNIFLAEMYLNARRFQEAVYVLSRETGPFARFFLGKAYEGLGQQEMAISCFNQLLPHAKDFPEVYYRLGMLSGKAGQEGRGYEFLGRFYMQTGNFLLAKINLEKAITRYGINSREAREVMQLLDSVKEEKK